jgi:hypothetical protein
MGHSKLMPIAALVIAAFLSAEINAADGRKVPPGPPAAGQPPAGGATAAPLKGEIRLPPGTHLGGMRVLHVGFDTLNQKFTEFSGSAKTYETGAKAMPEIAKACAAKTYSVQEQIAAGCTLNETLKQCTDKLYKHCIETYSSSGFSLPSFGVDPVTGQPRGGGQVSGFSTKQFQQSAQMTAAQARALGQMLGQYANEVEQTAKILVP